MGPEVGLALRARADFKYSGEVHADNLLQRFHDPQYAGDIDAPDGFGADGNVTCGDVVNLAIKVSDGLITDA